MSGISASPVIYLFIFPLSRSLSLFFFKQTLWPELATTCYDTGFLIQWSGDREALAACRPCVICKDGQLFRFFFPIKPRLDILCFHVERCYLGGHSPCLPPSGERPGPPLTALLSLGGKALLRSAGTSSASLLVSPEGVTRTFCAHVAYMSPIAVLHAASSSSIHSLLFHAFPPLPPHTHTHTQSWYTRTMYVHTNAHLHVCVHTQTNAHTHTLIPRHKHANTHTCTYTNTHTHTHTHTHTLTYTHTHTHTLRKQPVKQ